MGGGRRGDWTRGDERFWDGPGVKIEKFEKLTAGQKKCGMFATFVCVFRQIL